MKVLLLLTAYGSLADWRRIGSTGRELRPYLELRDRGVCFNILTYGNGSDGAALQEEGLGVIPVRKGMAGIFCRLPLVPFLHSLLVPILHRRAFRSCDVIKTNQMLGSWVGVIGKWLYHKPLYVRCGYEVHKYASFHQANPLYLFWLAFISKLAYRFADGIQIGSQSEKAYIIRRFGIAADKIQVRMNWIDTRLFSPRPGSEKHKDRLLYIGRLEKDKNISMLLSALQGSPYALDLVGQGSLQETLKQEAKALGVEVRFLGRFENEELPALINRYSLNVLCSEHEGNPKTLLECMACATAVIGLDRPGISDVIIHEQNGLLCQNEQELKAAIQLLMSDSHLAADFGLRARQWIEPRVSLAEQVEYELGLYERLAP